jgi:hypothetical protein
VKKVPEVNLQTGVLLQEVHRNHLHLQAGVQPAETLLLRHLHQEEVEAVQVRGGLRQMKGVQQQEEAVLHVAKLLREAVNQRLQPAGALLVAGEALPDVQLLKLQLQRVLHRDVVPLLQDVVPLLQAEVHLQKEEAE